MNLWRLILGVLLTLNGVCAAADILMTEFMAVNKGTLADEAAEFDDWVELFNATDEPVDIAGFYLSDDPDDATLWQIPPAPNGETIIPPEDYLIVWSDNDSDQGALHGPFKLASEGGVVSLSDPSGAAIDSIAYPAQHPDIAFGRTSIEGDTFSFLLAPTPGETNESTGVSQVGGVTFSKEAGVFREPFQLTMETVTEGSSIKYTTDSKEPGLFAGATYAGPIEIGSSTTLRAGVFVGGQRISPLQTQIYLAMDSELAAFESNLPVVLIDSRGHDFARDTSLGTEFEQSPVASAFFDGEGEGRTSLTTAPSYLGDAGMHVRGASSREWPKQQFRFETWGPSYEDRAVGLLGLPADADWILAAPYFDRSMMRNHLTFRWWEALGYESPRTEFFELFLDQDGDGRFTMADYQGVYVLTETIKRTNDRLDIASLKANEEGSFDGDYAIEATNVNQHWVSQKGTRLKYVEPREAELVPEVEAWIRNHFNDLEATVFSDDFEQSAEILDVPSHVDYDIMRELSRNIDGASTFLSFREGKVHMGPLWDCNQAYGLTRLFTPNPGWMTDGWNVEYMLQSAHWMKWWDHLENDPNYQTAWEDRWVELREGALSDERLLGAIDATASLLAESAERNFERWDILGKAIWVTGGFTRADPGEAERDSFAKEVAYVKDWLTARLAWIDSKVSSPPSFSPAGGAAVPDGFVLEIGQTEGFKPFGGTFYYTTTGRDPRLSGGGLNEAAIGYQEPFALTKTVTVSARARSIFGKWSSLRRATFLVGTEPASASNLTLSEFHYNPKGSDATEFIELANRGDRAIDLTGVRLAEAVEFTFGRRALEPGQVVLVVEDPDVFSTDDPSVAGAWEGRLANGGETILILSAMGEEILTLQYGAEGDWPGKADGLGVVSAREFGE